MSPEYQIRIQAILTADNGGTNGATITVSGIESRINEANLIYGSVGVKFVFNESTDLLQINSTLLNREFTILDPPDIDGDKWSKKPLTDSRSHDEAREQLARLFPRKLVVFFRKTVKLREDSGVWQLKNAGGSSGWAAFYVNMSRSGGEINLLAHEIGHYLQQRHPFVRGVKKGADAAEKIKKYVDDDGHPISEGLNALDGDLVWVTDTPADAAGSIFENKVLNLTKCGPVGQRPIKVNFNNGESKTYILQPDRSNIMSYFKDCPGQKTLSPQQGRRVRDGLEFGLRHNLTSLYPDSSYTIKRAGDETAGAFSELDVTMVRAGRIATAVRDGSDDLKLIVWDFEADGEQVIRRGDASAGSIEKVSVCNLGLGMLATAVISKSNQLKVIIWQVDENGQLVRRGSDAISGKINDVAACPVQIEYMATAARLADGTMQVDLWHVTAEGIVIHQDSKTTGKINSPTSGLSTPRISMDRIGANGFVTYVRDNGNDLKPILWHVEENGLKRLGSTNLNAASVNDIAGCMIAREVAVTAIQDKNNNLKLTAWYFPDDAQRLEERGSAQAGKISDVTVCRMGTELVVTGVRGNSGNLKLILWRVSKNGDYIVRRADETAGGFNRLAICHAGENLLATVVRNNSGNLKVIAWRLQAPKFIKFSKDLFEGIFLNITEQPTDHSV